MSSVITRSNQGQLLWPGIAALWGVKYEKYAPIYARIFKEVDRADKGLATERLVGYSGFGNAQIKTEGAPVPYDADGQASVNEFTYFVRALAFQVTQEELMDNQYTEIAMSRTASLAHSLQNAIEQDHADVLINAFNSNFIYGDGQSLISQSHPSKSGPQSNQSTMDADFSEAALEDITKQIMQAVNDRGLRIQLKPQTIIIQTDDVFQAERILQSQLRSGSQDNDINAMKSMGLFPGGVIGNPYFGTEVTDQWFVQTNLPDEVNLQSYWRVKPTIEKDNAFSTGNLKVKTYSRYTPVVGDWRSLYGSNGS